MQRIQRLQSLLNRCPPLARVMAGEPVHRAEHEAGRARALALIWGGLCHGLFAAAVLAMIVSMWFGMTLSLGTVPSPWAWAVNAVLIAQFPIGHSFLLSKRGQLLLARLAPMGAGRTLATTTYALLASLQLLVLFLLWTPSGIVWWRAEGLALWTIGCLYCSAWLLLIKASWDAGAEVQSGLLGWASLFRGVKPKFPPMPETGLFRLIRHPIYLAFALTTWLVPTWTPDQLFLAIGFTLYCAFGPLLKESRYKHFFGTRWRSYRDRTPYWVPRLGRRPAPSTQKDRSGSTVRAA